MQNLPRRLPTPFGAVKISIETHKGEAILLSRHILVGIVKVEVEPLSCLDEGCHVFCDQRDHGRTGVKHHVLYEELKILVPLLPEKKQPYRVERIVGDE